MSKLCWSVLAWSLCIAGLAQNSNPFAADGKAAAEGAGIFQKHCGSCHGKGGHGGRAPDLTRGALASGDRDSDIFLTISKGIDGTEMEAYGDRLGADNVWRIIAFVRSAGGNDVPLAGDAANGKAIFWGKGGCGNCHAVGDRGNRIGPDLDADQPPARHRVRARIPARSQRRHRARLRQRDRGFARWQKHPRHREGSG